MSHRKFLVLAATALMAATIAVTAQGAELKTPSPIGLLSEIYFEDKFEGDRLANHWQVTNPDPDGYIVEDGVLLVIGKAVGGLNNEATPNLFRLTKELPSGNWTATIKLKAEFQTGRDMLQFGLFADPATYVVTSFFGNADCCPNSSLTVRTKKKSGKQITHFDKTAWHRASNFQPFAETIPQPITLKLIKEGRIYRSAIHLDGQKNEKGVPIWIETDRVSALRAPKQFVLNASQWEARPGESLFLIDSVTIETPASE